MAKRSHEFQLKGLYDLARGSYYVRTNRLPGEVIESHGDTLVVACGDASALRLVEVQPEAKRRMVTRDFLNGTHLKVGDRFGQ
jgi:methionyl-tRNA formyltransferase